MGLAASTGSYIGSTHIATTTTLLFGILLATCALIIGMFFVDIKSKQICIAICLFFMFLSKSIHQDPAPPWVLSIRNDLCELNCRVISTPIQSPRTKGKMSIFDHREPTIWFYATATPARRITETELRIGVQINGEHEIKQGESLRCVGWLRESPKQIEQYTFYVINQPEKISQGDKKKQQQTTQQAVQHALTAHLNSEEKTLANALFLGIRDGGWSTMSDQFRKAGMSHILAISGLHVGLILCISTILFTWGRTGPIWNTTIIFVVVWLIGTVIEPRAPVIRALTMATLISAIKIVGIRCQSTGLLGITALLFLSFNPKGANTTTFQLSFVVVSALCVLLPQLQWKILGPSDPNGKIKTLTLRWIFFLWLTGFCAWSTAAPIVAHIFGTTSPSGILSSVPSILFLIITIICGVLKTSVEMIEWLPRGTFLLLFSSALHAVLFTASTFGNLPFAFLTNTPLTWMQSFSIVAWFTAWSLLTRKRYLLLVTFPTIVCFVCVNITNDNTKITTLNVGHGSCHIIQRAGQTVIIDAGSRSDLDTGTRKIIPTLRKKGVTTIKTIFITHADLDHLVGIIDVMQEYKTEKIVIAPQTLKHTTPPLELIIEEAKNCGTQIMSGSAGWTEIVGGLRLTIISPDKRTPYYSSNAASIVLHLQTNSRSILFTGDIDEPRITQLLQNEIGDVDILELPHHGQWSEESQKLINKKLPRAVIQSTNISRHAKDKWTMPMDTVRFVTAIDGDITTIISPRGSISISGSNAPATMEPCVFTN